MTKGHRTQHRLLGEHAGLRLDHEHGVLCAGDHEIEIRFGERATGRVEQVFAIAVADTRPADRAGKRHAGQRQRRRCTDHGRDIRIDLGVHRHHGRNDLDLVGEAIGEQRTDGAIDQARGQGLLLRGPALTLEEPARHLARGVGSFLVIDGQGEEGLARIRLAATYGGNQDNGIGHVDPDRTGGLACDLARLEPDRMIPVLEFLAMD